MRTLLLTLAVSALAAGSARAVAVSLVNPGFEDDAAAAAVNGWTDATPTGWLDPDDPLTGGTNANANFVEIIGGFASEGTVHLGFDANENGIMYQDTTTEWAPNTTYTLTVGVGRRAGFGASTNALFGLTSTDDGVIVANDAFATAVFSQIVDTSPVAAIDNTFADMTLTFTTGAVAPGGNIRLFMKNQDTVSRLHVDNFRLDATPVPEPSGPGMLALATGLLVRCRRGRRA